MNSPFRLAIEHRMGGRSMQLAGVALVIVATGFQFAGGAETTMRVLGSRDEVKPPIADGAAAKRETVARRDSAVQRESILRVATASSSVLGRQESKLVDRRVSEPATQPEAFTKAMQEAAALANAVNEAAPANVSQQERKASPNRSVPPANISALTIAAPAPAPNVPAPTASVPATATASVPMIRGTTPVAIVSRPAPTAEATGHRASDQVATTRVVDPPAPFVPALSPVVRAPAPLAPVAPKVVDAPAKIEDEPVHVARVPASVVHAPSSTAGKMPTTRNEIAPLESVPAAHATYHPHSKPAPPVNGIELSDTCLTESAPVEYDVCGELDCVYGPGQSGAQYVCGVDCGVHGAPCCAGWGSAHCIPWSLFGPGEYVGPSRTEHVSNYYLRVNDLLTLTYINSRQKMGERYRLGIGDRVLIESSLDESLRREVQIQPDGEISLPIVGEVMAAGKTVKELRDDLTEVFKEAQRQPQITVTPLDFNQGQVELIRAVTAATGSNGQSINLKVTPEGTIQPPGLGSVYVQGLTLAELRSELEARYAETFGAGLMLSPALTERATTYVFVGGEVVAPNRYTLEGPTTVMQAIALAGGWNNGANLHQVVVFRRDENWCLKAIKIDVRKPLYGNDPCPVNDVWLRDNDLVLVPKSKILCATDVIDLYMTRGVYAAFPVTFVQDLSTGSSVGSSVVPVP